MTAPPLGMPPHTPPIHPVPFPVPKQTPPPPAFHPTVLHAQLQQLTALIQALQVQNTALQDQLDEQHAAATQLTVPPAPMPPAQPNIKVATPDAFNRSADHAEEFLHHCDIYFLSVQGLAKVQSHLHPVLHVKGPCLVLSREGTEEVVTPNHKVNWEQFKADVQSAVISES
jgi:hypothetical protein